MCQDGQRTEQTWRGEIRLAHPQSVRQLTVLCRGPGTLSLPALPWVLSNNQPNVAFLLQVPYFDVLTHVNGVRLGSDRSDKQLYHLLADKENTPTTLNIYNYLTKRYRETVIVPNRTWGGQGLIGMCGCGSGC